MRTFAKACGYACLMGTLAIGFAATASAQGGYPIRQAGPAYAPPAGGAPVTQQPYLFEGAYVNAHGEPIAGGGGLMPASYYGCGDGCASGCGCGSCAPGEFHARGSHFGGCGGAGGCCDGCSVGSCLGACIGPNDQCGPHYFDFSVEYLYYERDDDVISPSMLISTFGFANDPDVINGTIPASDFALVGSDINTDEGNGYRLKARCDVGALSVAEFTYSGIYTDDEQSVMARGAGATNTLFSIFSLYGAATNGDFGMGGAGAPTGDDFEETDNALLHRLDYQSELQTVEATYRRYWVGHSPRVSGTLLVGFRYTSLEEDLRFFSNSAEGAINIDGNTENRLAGAQAGGDAWVTLFPGFRVGGEAKAGVYNNDYSMANITIASDGSPDTTTFRTGNQVAFLTEAKLSAVANISPSISLRVGYEVLFLTDLAQMGDSLFTSMPYGDINNISSTTIGGGLGPQTGSTVDGEVLYHGAHAGLECTW